MRREATLVIIGTVLIGGLVLAFRARPYRVPERTPSFSATRKPEIVSNLPETPPAESVAPRGGLSPDGLPVPELPKDAPNSVSFGVIVLSYRGAEGAPSDARPKEAALAKAKELLPEASRDFDEAVKKGDHGSMADAGSIPRGVLEPTLEYALFTLKKGEVYGEPLDSPRGYWLVRRK
jgi:PPIC-type PPIASE domain